MDALIVPLARAARKLDLLGYAAGGYIQSNGLPILQCTDLAVRLRHAQLRNRFVLERLPNTNLEQLVSFSFSSRALELGMV